MALVGVTVVFSSLLAHNRTHRRGTLFMPVTVGTVLLQQAAFHSHLFPLSRLYTQTQSYATRSSVWSAVFDEGFPHVEALRGCPLHAINISSRDQLVSQLSHRFILVCIISVKRKESGGPAVCSLELPADFTAIVLAARQ